MHNSTIKGFVASSECSYINGLSAKMEYIAIDECPTDIYQAFLERGWRRFGYLHFRPVCDGCEKCESLRIVANDFKLSKSMQKVKVKNKKTKILIDRPAVSDEKIELFNKYHCERSSSRGWEPKKHDKAEYESMLVKGANEFGYEVDYMIEDKLVGVDYIDVSYDGISAVYFIYDPDFAKYSLGVYSLLIQVDLAKKLGLKYVYLGYGVQENASLEYKYRYKPLEKLQHPSPFGQKAIWNEFATKTEI